MSNAIWVTELRTAALPKTAEEGEEEEADGGLAR